MILFILIQIHSVPYLRRYIDMAPVNNRYGQISTTLPFSPLDLTPNSIIKVRERTIARWSWFEEAIALNNTRATRLGTLSHQPFEPQDIIFTKLNPQPTDRISKQASQIQYHHSQTPKSDASCRLEAALETTIQRDGAKLGIRQLDRKAIEA